MDNRDYVNRGVEVSTHVGLVILLVAACFLFLRPFLPLITWGIIIAISVYPSYRKLQVALRDRGVLSSVVITILLLAFLVCPVVLLAGTLVGGIQTLAAHLKDGTPIIPPPPASIETWPVIGVPLKSVWSLASTNIALREPRTHSPPVYLATRGRSLSGSPAPRSVALLQAFSAWH